MRSIELVAADELPMIDKCKCTDPEVASDGTEMSGAQDSGRIRQMSDASTAYAAFRQLETPERPDALILTLYVECLAFLRKAQQATDQFQSALDISEIGIGLAIPAQRASTSRNLLILL